MANFFKIINITGSLPKRHPKKSVSLDIKYANNFKSETIKLDVGAEMFITCDRLPMNIQKLNLEKLIIVNRVTQNDMKRTERKARQPKLDVTVIEEKPVEKPKRQYRTKKKTTTTKKTKE